MRKFLNWIDEIAHINQESVIAKWLERIAFIFLILMIVCAPHSIAATQIAWLSGMLAWAIRLFIKPRPKFFRTSLDVALWALAGWSVVTALCSYAPDISLDKLRGVGLFLIFYFIINNLRTKRAAIFLAGALIFSSMVSVIWTPIERIIGRGVEISGVKSDSPLSKAVMVEDSAVEGFAVKGYIRGDDTLLEANKKKIRDPAQLIDEIEKNEITRVKVARLDYTYTLEVRRDELLPGNSAIEQLGFESWKRNRSWRAAGFYGAFITFAEVLQLILSLTFGIFIVFLQNKNNPNSESQILDFKSKIQNPQSKILLGFCVLAMMFALLLTATRASQAGFMVSAFVITWLGASRKIFWTLMAIALPLALICLLFLQQYRNVSFFDSSDNSTTWRETVYREGFDLWTKSARNFTVGVGMDSIKRFAKDWHLFDDGRLPMGHFHSTPLQLAVERGLPALLIWLWILFIYAKTLWKGFNSQIQNPKSKIQNGIVLGCLGGLVGFFTSGLVHYNLGDGEVAMAFYILMGLSVFLAVKK